MESTVIKQEVIRSSKSETGFVFVSTCDTFDAGLETMVFECDSWGNVTDWGQLDVNRWNSEDSAIVGHQEMINAWRK